MQLFEESWIGSIRLPNRIIRSATNEGVADREGIPGPAHTKIYTRLARGGVGLIITGFAAVDRRGVSPLPGQLVLAEDSAIAAYRTMVKAVHDTGAKIILQIAHCGPHSRPAADGSLPLAPSRLSLPWLSRLLGNKGVREISPAEIETLIDAFVAAIGRAQQAGFDGVQLHAAHGYMLAAFLSPYSNQRRDAWGGSTEKRFRILGEIIQRSRVLYGDFPILIKINGSDGRPGGMRPAEAAEIARLAEKAGCSAVEVSGGVEADGFYTIRGEVPVAALMANHPMLQKVPKFLRPLMPAILKKRLQSPQPLHLFNVEAARIIKQAISIPVIVVGGIRTGTDMERIVGEVGIDYVSMSRPFIREPLLVHRLQEGLQEASACLDCNECLAASRKTAVQCYNGRYARGELK